MASQTMAVYKFKYEFISVTGIWESGSWFLLVFKTVPGDWDTNDKPINVVDLYHNLQNIN